jgi:hypothetical protein
MNLYREFAAALNQLLGGHLAARITVDSSLVRCDRIFGDLGMTPEERNSKRRIAARPTMPDGVVMTIGSVFPYGLQLVNYNLLEQLTMNNG